MLEALKEKMPEYTDHRQTDAGIVILELLAAGLDILSFYQDVIANEVFLPTEEQRSNVLKWCNLLGYVPQIATPAVFEQVFTRTDTSMREVIPAGTCVKTEATSTEDSVYFETVSSLELLAGVSSGTVLVKEGKTVKEAYVGTSTGSPSQSFTLDYKPVLIDSIQILSQKGDTTAVWKRVNNFVESGSADNHFVVQEDENYNITILFGDGVFGRVPTTGADIYCTYRVGGGDRGNVGANKITAFDENLSGYETYNPSTPKEYGKDRESIEDIKIHAPVLNRTRWGTLTLQDFEEVLKMNFPEILHVHAERDTLDYNAVAQAINGMTDPNTIIDTVIEDMAEVVDNVKLWLYVTDSEGKHIPLTEDYKDTLENFFNENLGGRKAIGTNKVLFYDAPVEEIDASLILYIAKGYDPDVVSEKVKKIVSEEISPEAINIGSPFMLSKLLSRIYSVDGVQGVQFRNPADEITYFDSRTVIALRSIELDAVEV